MQNQERGKVEKWKSGRVKWNEKVNQKLKRKEMNYGQRSGNKEYKKKTDIEKTQ